MIPTMFKRVKGTLKWTVINYELTTPLIILSLCFSRGLGFLCGVRCIDLAWPLLSLDCSSLLKQHQRPRRETELKPRKCKWRCQKQGHSVNRRESGDERKKCSRKICCDPLWPGQPGAPETGFLLGTLVYAVSFIYNKQCV